MNTDYDFKRKPLDDGTTQPFATAEEFTQFREGLWRGQRKGGRRAAPELVFLQQPAGCGFRRGRLGLILYRRYVHSAIAYEQPGWQSGAGPTKTAVYAGHRL